MFSIGMTKRFLIVFFFLILSFGCTMKGVEVPKPPIDTNTIFELHWSGASDPFEPIPEGWNISSGNESMYSVVQDKLGVNGYFLKTINEEGASRILTIPIDLSTVSGVFYVELEAGVDEVGGGDAIFFPFDGIFDFRLNSKGIPTLFLADKSRIFLGDETTYEVGTLLRMQFEINSAQRTIDRIWVNGSLVRNFKGLDWLSTTNKGNFQLIATTGSHGHIYWKSISVSTPE